MTKKYQNPKEAVTFRISRLQALQLKLPPYKDNKAILVRLLLDSYFAGHLPAIKQAFEKEVSNKDLILKQGGCVKDIQKNEAKRVIKTWMKQRKELHHQQIKSMNQNQSSKQI